MPATVPERPTDPTAGGRLKIAAIYAEGRAIATERGREILARYPDAEVIEVASHWRIPELHGDDELTEDWNRVKRTALVLGHKGAFRFRENGRSADWIGPGLANGCAMSCAYCYVARRKGAANPITLFLNVEEALAATARFAAKLPPKVPSQTDPEF